jgi:hypothetical protein
MTWIYQRLFWLFWPIVRRHLERSSVTSCWLEAWLSLLHDRQGITEQQRSAAMHFAKAMEDHHG